jgi:hypothetical protein
MFTPEELERLCASWEQDFLNHDDAFEQVPKPGFPLNLRVMGKLELEPSSPAAPVSLGGTKNERATLRHS